MQTPEFKHQDKLQAIGLCERNSSNNNRRKSIAVQHFSDSGQADSPAELVTTEIGHSPVEITAINGGYYLAKELDSDVQPQQGWNQQPQAQSQSQYAQRG